VAFKVKSHVTRITLSDMTLYVTGFIVEGVKYINPQELGALART